MNFLPPCMYTYYTYVWCSQRSEVGIKVPGSRAMLVGSCRVGAGNGTQPVLLTPEASLQPQYVMLNNRIILLSGDKLSRYKEVVCKKQKMQTINLFAFFEKGSILVLAELELAKQPRLA